MSSARLPRRFSRRVFVVFALSLLAVSVIFTGYFLYVQQQRLAVALADRGKGLGGLLATGARIAVFSENEALVRETLQGVVDRRDVLSAAVFSNDRKLVAAAGRSLIFKQAAGALSPRDGELVQRLGAESGCLNRVDRAVLETFCPVLLRQPQDAGRELYFEDATVEPGRTYIGFVRVTLDRTSVRRELGAQALRSLGLMVVILLAGTGAGLLFARRVTEPLERLTDAVRVFGESGQITDLHAMPDDEIGRLAAAFSKMTRDLIEREREKDALAGRLLEARKMEAVGALSQGISHDFKNILSTLKGAVHILQKGLPDNDLVLKYTGRMQVTLDRARNLVERLVAFSRALQHESVPVDVTALLTRLSPAIRDVVGDGVRLSLESPGEPVLVRGDAGSLEQLVMNLAYNARDAMPEGGTLSVRLECAVADRGSGVVRITVADTGTGMAPEVHLQLFKPFFTTKGAGAGMGLGLSIVRGIVEQHRGRVEVETEPGKGTCFRVELPPLGATDDGEPLGSGSRKGVDA